MTAPALTITPDANALSAPPDPAPSRRSGDHRNALGFLRLLFALLVIVSHVPEVVDGDPHRELFYYLTRNGTFGGLAVNGFFLISGYLITGSYRKSRSVRSYLVKRVARIYPAFVVASVVCLVIVAPLAGAAPTHGLHHVVADLVRMLTLQRPTADGAFANGHYGGRYGALDGAMWTIQYEFACYLLVIVLGAAGVLTRPRLIVGLAAALLILSAAMPSGAAVAWLSREQLFPGQPAALPGLAGMFLAGASFYALRDSITLSARIAWVAAIAFAITSFLPIASIFGNAVFGGYLVFYVAQRGGSSWIGRINNTTDISYGTYLYAWPIEQLLIRYMGSDSLVGLALLTAAGAMTCGLVSWIVVERPFMRRLRG